jgi:hypothetical protein
MFNIGDKVQAKHEIIDGDGVVCAETGDMGTIVEVIDDEEGNDAYDVDWPVMACVTGGHEMEDWRLRAVA